jgi:hypothetical protein
MHTERGAAVSPSQTHNFSFTINMHNRPSIVYSEAPEESVSLSKLTRFDNSGTITIQQEKEGSQDVSRNYFI